MTPLYTDALVELTDEELTLKHYYYPRGGSKKIKLADIEEIVEKIPTVFDGKWRLWGTGSFRVWFARDYQRPKREAIYYVKIKHKFVKAGFTVEDAKVFSTLLERTGLLRRESSRGD
jgi:hypothetical protein